MIRLSQYEGIMFCVSIIHVFMCIPQFYQLCSMLEAVQALCCLINLIIVENLCSFIPVWVTKTVRSCSLFFRIVKITSKLAVGD